jgi:hypothetical protein
MSTWSRWCLRGSNKGAMPYSSWTVLGHRIRHADIMAFKAEVIYEAMRAKVCHQYICSITGENSPWDSGSRMRQRVTHSRCGGMGAERVVQSASRVCVCVRRKCQWRYLTETVGVRREGAEKGERYASWSDGPRPTHDGRMVKGWRNPSRERSKWNQGGRERRSKGDAALIGLRPTAHFSVLGVVSSVQRDGLPDVRDPRFQVCHGHRAL